MRPRRCHPPPGRRGPAPARLGAAPDQRRGDEFAQSVGRHRRAAPVVDPDPGTHGPDRTPPPRAAGPKWADRASHSPARCRSDRHGRRFLELLGGQSLTLLTEAFERTSVAKAVIALDATARGRLVEVNAALCALLGYPREALVGRCADLAFDAIDWSTAAAVLDEMAAGTVRDTAREWRLVRHDGSRVWVSSRAVLAHDGTGAAYVVVEAVETTDRHALAESEAALRRSEEQFRTAFDGSPLGLIIVDEDGRFLQANPAASALTGRPPADLVGLTYRDITDPRDLTVGTGTGDIRYDKRLRHPDGRTVWTRLTLSLIPGPAGESWRLLLNWRTSPPSARRSGTPNARCGACARPCASSGRSPRSRPTATRPCAWWPSGRSDCSRPRTARSSNCATATTCGTRRGGRARRHGRHPGRDRPIAQRLGADHRRTRALPRQRHRPAGRPGHLRATRHRRDADRPAARRSRGHRHAEDLLAPAQRLRRHRRTATRAARRQSQLGPAARRRRRPQRHPARRAHRGADPGSSSRPACCS